MSIAICLFVRNEERDIAEWIVYHSLIGFDSFIIYHNSSTDNTYCVIDRLRRFLNIKIIDWPRNSKYAQLEAYDDCIKNFASDFEWIAFIDSDEFINPVADGSIKKFLSFHGNSNAIALNWSLFGSSGHDRIPTGLIIEEFTHRAIDRHGINFHTKMMVRPKKVIRISNPHLIDVEGDIVHADGKPFHEASLGLSADLFGFEICRVNHYFVKSAEHWEAKMRRGYREGIRPADHFTSHDTNDVVDLSAAYWGGNIRQVLAALDQVPLRERSSIHAGASSDEEKLSDGFASIANDLDDVIYRAPPYSLSEGNDLFDLEWYRKSYADVAKSDFDPFEHYVKFGYKEGRRPCSREKIENYFRAAAYRRA